MRYAIVLAAVAMVLAAVPASAQTSGGGADAATQVFLPFLAAATTIERFWEVLFTTIERFAGALGGWLGAGGKLVSTLSKTVVEATKNLANTTATGAVMEKAERDLAVAQGRLEDGLKSPTYLALKRVITLGGSLPLGIWVASLANLQFFAAAGVKGIDSTLDTILTGLFIGSGPGPLHAIIGTMSELRKVGAGISDLARGNALRSAVESLKGSAPAAAVPAVAAPVPPAVPPAPSAMTDAAEPDLAAHQIAKALVRSR